MSPAVRDRPNRQRHAIAQRVVMVLFLAIIGFFIWGMRQSAVARSLVKGERVPMLAFGIDAVDISRHTDTLMLAVLDPVRKNVHVLSIPRDTRIDLPGYRFNRINEIYGYHLRTTGDPTKAAASIREGVEYLLSSSSFSLRIPYYVQMDFSGFQKMIDLMGGVWVNVRRTLNDGNPDHFSIEAGRHLLSGRDALRYVRFRGPAGDRGRIFRQHEFVRDVVRRWVSPQTLLRLPDFVRLLRDSLDSNVTMWDWVYLFDGIHRVRSDRIHFYILPGDVARAYWMPQKELAVQLTQNLMEGKAITITRPPIAPQWDRMTVNVWNASGRRGLGYKVTQTLRRHGFDVLDFNNYPTPQPLSRVIDRRGSIAPAKKAADILGIEDYHSEPHQNVFIDMEVIIGENYDPAP